jgi:hypothetical protein
MSTKICNGCRIQKGAVSQPRTLGAALDKPTIIKDTASPTEPNTRKCFATRTVTDSTAYLNSPENPVSLNREIMSVDIPAT